MEKIFHFFFVAFYFGMKRDKTLPKVGRVKYLIAFELYQMLAGVFFLIWGGVGLFRFDDVIMWSIVVATIILIFFLGDLICKHYVKRNESKFLKTIKQYTPKQRKIYAIVGYFSCLVIFLFMMYCYILGVGLENYLYPD